MLCKVNQIPIYSTTMIMEIDVSLSAHTMQYKMPE
jgi:hypothetical protein